ncbi:hypothetical protein GCM10027093_21440 [Paraburkholderia jirisanensis]
MDKNHPKDEKPNDGGESRKDDRPVKLDLTRMAAAIRGPYATIPVGLSREEKRRFILDHAK